MTETILYTTLGSAIGAGALGGAIFLRKKWDAWIEKKVAVRCADRMATEEMAIGRLALKTRQALKPDLESLELRTENKIKTFILESESRVTRTVIAAAQSKTAVIKEFTAAFDPFPKQPIPEAATAPKPAATWDWKSDRAAVAVAGELSDSLVKLRMPKDQALAKVNACMDRCAKPGCTHDELFSECFKKS